MNLRNSLLLAALIGVATAAVPATAAADSSLRVVPLHDLAAQIYAAADDVSQAREQHRSMADVAANLRELRGAFDAATHANSPGRAHADEVFANKLRELAPLLASIEHAINTKQAGNIPSLVPAHLPAALRARFGVVDEHDGGACDHALGLGAGIEVDGRLRERGEVWFRFEAKGPALYRVSTAATPLDTEIAVYARCPKTTEEAPLSANDDAFGLAAAAPIDLLSTPGPRWVRVRNLGPKGAVAVQVQSAGTISGRVTDLRTGASLANARVRLFDQDGSYATGGYPDANGNFTTTVTAGSYHAVAGADHHLIQVWPQGYCTNNYYDLDNCDLSHAALIVVTANTLTPGVNFALDPGARISGRIRDHLTGLAATDAHVTLYDNAGQPSDSASVDDAGRYDFQALLGGVHYALATSPTHMPQLYANMNCMLANCSALAGTPIPVGSDAVVQNVDFDLKPYLYLNVAVHLVDDGDANYSTVNVYNTAGALVLSQAAYGPPTPSAIGPFDPGTYRVTASSSGHLPQLYNQIDCAADCVSNLASGTPVTLANGSPAPTLAFNLKPTPTVSGKITDSVSGAGLFDASVLLVSTSGSGYAIRTSTAPDGTYLLSRINPGSYYVIARSDDHHDEAYPNASCLDFAYDSTGCSLAQAQPLVISLSAANLTHIDMALSRNSSIAGKMHYRALGTAYFPIQSASVLVYDSQGHFVASSFTDENGGYLIKDLVPGTYYAATSDYRYFGQAYGGVNCPVPNQACDPTGGMPIVLGSAQDIVGIDLDPIANSLIVGRVTNATTGQGIAGAALDIWDGSNNEYCSSTAADANGYYLAGNANYSCNQSVAFKVSSDAGSSFINQVFSGVNCPTGPAYLGLCSLANATRITVPTTQPQPIVANFVLHPNDVVFANGFD
ncbi:MAG: carboxypeptidase-like regulatory domain-containing protein [Dokdonella sp.]